MIPEDIIIMSRKPFVSRIDWSSWNSEIPENKHLLEEYLEIEREKRENNAWMKTPRNYRTFSEVDEINLNSLKKRLEKKEFGSDQITLVERLINNLEIAKDASTTYQGTSEQYVQELSENFKHAFPDFDITFRGAMGNRSMRGNLAESTNKNIGTIFTSDKFSATAYGADRIIKGETDIDFGILCLVYNKSSNSFSVNAAKNSWKAIPREFLPDPHNKLKPLNISLDNTSKTISTDDISSYIQKNDIDYCTITNVRDGPSSNENLLITKEVIFNHRTGNYLKSRWYNNGMFNMKDPNIYK